jgi:hypothetical protein
MDFSQFQSMAMTLPQKKRPYGAAAAAAAVTAAAAAAAVAIYGSRVMQAEHVQSCYCMSQTTG